MRKPEYVYYDVRPKVVRADSCTEITIEALFKHVLFSDKERYTVTHIPCQGLGDYQSKELPFELSEKSLKLKAAFANEQEHVIFVEKCLDEGRKQQVGAFKIYSLKEDLFGRKPLKGDFHLHTNYSDGIESPAYVAASCRKVGFDFMALTDHHLYQPSIEAQKAFDEIRMDFKIYPGEEVHPPGNPVHMLNFGGNFSVNAFFKDAETYKQEVMDYAHTLEIPEGVNQYHYASCLWCFEKIKEAKGLSVYCHPYWYWRNSYYVVETLNTALMNGQHYDALELIGGYQKYEIDSNTLQVARYHDERARGKTVPIVGVSDAHGCHTGELFNWYYTIAFAESDNLESIFDSIKTCHSVAVEAVADETPRAHGPFRLVKYSLFLFREFFPIHDKLCGKEGEYLLDYVKGDASAKDDVEKLKGTIPALYEKYWA